MATRFTVLDFETTSRDSSARATEIGIVALDDLLCASSIFESVIKPPVPPMKQSLSYSRLSLDQLDAAPEFVQVWPSIAPYFDQRIVVAHKKEFEQAVISLAFADAGLPPFDLPFVCTLDWSKRILKHQVNGHSLLDVCAYLDIDLLAPHEAKVDAVATAALFKVLYEQSAEMRTHCEELASKTVPIPTPKVPGAKPLIRRRHVALGRPETELQSIAAEIRTNSRIKIVVVTGTLMLSESKFSALVSSAGYEFKESPATAGTAFVVQGYNGGQSKIKKAIQYGRPVLTEQDAVWVLNILREWKEG